MEKFEVLKYNKIVMSTFGLYSFSNEPGDEKENGFFKSRMALFMMFSLFVISVPSSASGLIANWPNLELVIMTGITTAAGLQAGGMFTSFGCHMRKVKSLHFHIKGIVDGVGEHNILANYRNIEIKCQKYTTIIVSYIFLNLSMPMQSLILSFYNIYIGDENYGSWFLPFVISPPFNTDKLWKWYILWIIQMDMTVPYSFAISLITAYFVCCCLYLGGICDHLQRIFESINEMVEMYRSEKNPRKINMINRRIQKGLHDAVEIHIKIVTIFKLMADINSGSILALLPPNVLFTACVLTYTDNYLNEMSKIITILTISVSSVIWPFLWSYFASNITLRLLGISNVAYDSNWFDFPLQLQKYVVLIIARSQEPIVFSGYGIISCTLEIFGKIIKTSFSYFIIFRGLKEP